MAPHAALAVADADYTLALVTEDEAGDRPAEYFALNPWGQVPTLEDGDLILTESVAIMLHLADRFPDAGLGAPVGTRARSELYRWLSYLATAVQATHMHWFYPERFTTDRDAAGAIRTCATAALCRHVDWVDRQLANRAWVVDGDRSGADLFLFMLTRWGRLHEPPAREGPNVRAHFERVLQWPGVQRMMVEEGL